MKVLIIDNYDSFVYNLVQYVGELGAQPLVYRNDEITLRKAAKLHPERIIISPGPGTPEDVRYFGVCSEILRNLSRRVSTLGVCLGHQGIISTFGGKIIGAKSLKHGKTSLIKHDGRGIFKGVENPFVATRYHSLIGDKETAPSCLEITAESMDSGEIMAVRHFEYPIEGVQFHPESVLTTNGKRLIKNFLEDE
ncbi:MAG: anthranilate synthase component II [Candidatus Jordarchaeum sp.]|uniref:anthranilate synthase component II n=1 Tax=Candidatus Jordarchaeum sp. TaxID=2823881 RepID=UPI00404979CC